MCGYENKLKSRGFCASSLVGCFGFNGPLRQYFSLCQALSKREGEREEKRIDESENVRTTPTRIYYKGSRPLTYCSVQSMPLLVLEPKDKKEVRSPLIVVFGNHVDQNIRSWYHRFLPGDISRKAQETQN